MWGYLVKPSPGPGRALLQGKQAQLTAPNHSLASGAAPTQGLGRPSPQPTLEPSPNLRSLAFCFTRGHTLLPLGARLQLGTGSPSTPMFPKPKAPRIVPQGSTHLSGSPRIPSSSCSVPGQKTPLGLPKAFFVAA